MQNNDIRQYAELVDAKKQSQFKANLPALGGKSEALSPEILDSRFRGNDNGGEENGRARLGTSLKKQSQFARRLNGRKHLARKGLWE